MAQGLINNGVSVSKSFSPNEYQLLADYTVSGSAITSFTFGTLLAPLRINADEEVVLVATIDGTAFNNVSIYFNGNTTGTNYYNQLLSASNTSVSGLRTNSSYALWTSLNCVSLINIKLTNNGYIVWQSNNERYFSTSNVDLINIYGTSTFTTSQITSLTITHASANGIGIGSRFQLYKVKGQVQQTWATT